MRTSVRGAKIFPPIAVDPEYLNYQGGPDFLRYEGKHEYLSGNEISAVIIQVEPEVADLGGPELSIDFWHHNCGILSMDISAVFQQVHTPKCVITRVKQGRPGFRAFWEYSPRNFSRNFNQIRLEPKKTIDYNNALRAATMDLIFKYRSFTLNQVG